MRARLFHIYGPLWIHSYGVMIFLGLLLFMYLTYRHPLRYKIMTDDSYFQMISWGILGALIGGRLFSWLTEWDSYVWYEVFLPWIGGLGILSAIIGAILSLTIFFKMQSIPVFQAFDLLALFAPLLQSIARFGCFFAGCCYGLPASLHTWGVITYTDPWSFAPLEVPLYPTQLYASGASFLIFLVLSFYVKNCMTMQGGLFYVYLILESGARFLLDFWRGDSVPGPLFTRAQWVALFLFFVSATALYIHARYNKKEKRSYML